MTSLTPRLEPFHGVAEDDIGWMRYQRPRKFRFDVEPEPPLPTRTLKTTTTTEELTFAFQSHYHPYASELTAALLKGSVAGLLAVDTQPKIDGSRLPASPPADYYRLYAADDFQRRYNPDRSIVTGVPVKDLDFRPEGAYAVYNWELFFHAPMAIALHLSRNRRFEDAQRWLHHLFDPTDASEGDMERFWKVQPFQRSEVEMVAEILDALASSEDASPAQLALRQRTLNAIDAWRRAPFRPHLVARTRPGAYKVRTLMAYLDNLIAWGDSLFQQDTAESIDEAATHYLRAAQLLGRRPRRTPAHGSLGAQSYRSLRKDLDGFSNALRRLEANLAFDLSPPAQAVDDAALTNVRSIGQSTYFCVPGNERMLAYWDTVGDRLFKIRNSLNFKGSFRQLPLFDPPIDPGVLARGVAAGLDLRDVIAGVNEAISPMRFSWWWKRALDLCQEAKLLGAAMLQAMEREDAETLQAMRSRHESVLSAAMESIRYGQLQEARKQREGLERSIAGSVQRHLHFEQLLGRKPSEVNLPEIDALDKEGLAGFKYRNQEPEIGPRSVDYDQVTGMQGVTGGHVLNRNEVAEILLSRSASDSMAASSRLDAVAAMFGAIPTLQVNASFWGVGASFIFGGQLLAAGPASAAASTRAVSAEQGAGSLDAGRLGSFARRDQDWTFQSNAAASDISVLYKQLRAAQIREAVAEKDLELQRKQIQQSREIEVYLTDDRSSRLAPATLYALMRRETRGLYARVLDFAAEVARKAQRSYEYELGLGTGSAGFISGSYLKGKEGLLAAEALEFDIRRMEVAFGEQNTHSLEVREDVSLLNLDPLALISFKTTGTCTFEVSEDYLDRLTPGHYFRRLKTVAVTIPCITGPRKLLHCTLELQSSRIRTTDAVGEGYARKGDDDRRFRSGPDRKPMIVTSGAMNDDGVFPANDAGDRYGPFEGYGAISTWKLSLPTDLPDFDHGTISDVLIHMQFTARSGIPENVVINDVKKRIAATPTIHLLSIRMEFPEIWAAAALSKGGDDWVSIDLPLRREHLPYWVARLPSVELVGLGVHVLTQQQPDLRLVVGGTDQETRMAGVGNRFESVGLKPDSMKSIPGRLKFDLRCPGRADDVWVTLKWIAR